MPDVHVDLRREKQQAGRLFMKYHLDDIAEIAAKFNDLDTGIKKDLILITALPGFGDSETLISKVDMPPAQHQQLTPPSPGDRSEEEAGIIA